MLWGAVRRIGMWFVRRAVGHIVALFPLRGLIKGWLCGSAEPFTIVLQTSLNAASNSKLQLKKSSQKQIPFSHTYIQYA